MNPLQERGGGGVQPLPPVKLYADTIPCPILEKAISMAKHLDLRHVV